MGQNARLFHVEYTQADEPSNNGQYLYTDAEAAVKLQMYWPIICQFEEGDTLTVQVDLFRLFIRAE